MADHTALPDGPEHPDGRYPSFQVRCHSWADTLLLATLAVMFVLNRWTRVEQWSPVQVDGQSSELAAVPKPLSPSALTCRTLSIDALAYRKWIAQTSRAPSADHASTGPPEHRMAAGTGGRRDQAQPAQPGCAPAEPRRRSKNKGNPLPPFPPVCGSDTLAMFSDLSGR